MIAYPTKQWMNMESAVANALQGQYTSTLPTNQNRNAQKNHENSVPSSHDESNIVSNWLEHDMWPQSKTIWSIHKCD